MNINLRWATLVTIFSLGIVLLTIQTASAASHTPSPSPSTHITALPLSAALCAQLKKHFPKEASNPKRCTLYHQNYVRYYVYPVVAVNDQTFYTYNTGIPSKAAVYQAFIQFIGYGYAVWQRRECYGNMSCNWHTDNG